MTHEVSKTIKDLEQELDTELLYRVPCGVEATEAGGITSDSHKTILNVLVKRL
ncbi:helix-turn-helix domain-containing protein [Gracilibacillus saliphilus]|uniref:helix-turn-helix domain-containing protein n=1 Tax=Gracilibacillus saliphilus TaxID=543890 RepID=UPI003B5281DB